MRSSWANITKVKTGVYRIRYWAEGPEGYKRRSKTIRGTRKDAESARAALMLRHADDFPCPTVKEAYDAWYLPEITKQLEAYEKYGSREQHKSIKPLTYKQYISAWAVHIEPQFGSRRLDSLRYAEVQAWLDTKSSNVALKSLAVMREIYRFALLNEAIDKNILEYTYRLPPNTKKAPSGVYTLDELNSKIWPAVWGKPYEGAFIMSAFCGCRTGEALSPMLSEIEFVKYKDVLLALIPISRQIGEHGEIGKDGDLKNKWSVRLTVAPPPYSLRLQQLKEQGEKRGDTFLSDDSTGEPIGQWVLRYHFSRDVKKLDMHYEQFRALRRSWRTWISSQGISQELLERTMGHVGEGTTATHYLKPYKEVLVEAFGDAFSKRPIKQGLGWLNKKMGLFGTKK